jgi:RNA polymerase sigma-70 factor (ECF subfamily)
VDETAFNALYKALADSLWKYAARASGRPDIADDILQESFFRLLKSKHADLPPSEARLYLFRIATNLLNDRWRGGYDTVGQEVSEEATFNSPDLVLDATRMLQSLKPRASQLLWLAFVEGMSHKEIAKATGLNTMSVRVMLARAKTQAKAYFALKGHADE